MEIYQLARIDRLLEAHNFDFKTGIDTQKQLLGKEQNSLQFFSKEKMENSEEF